MLPISLLRFLDTVLILLVLSIVRPSESTAYAAVYLTSSDSSANKDCNATCNYSETLNEFNDCFRDCQNTGKTAEWRPSKRHYKALYPSAPKNLTVKLTVQDEITYKDIRAQVKWNAEPDIRRGFVLTVIAKERTCQSLFPGYHEDNIPSTSRAWVIPTHWNAKPLTLDHGCNYSVEMHSLPYPYRKAEYSAGLMFTVPECIQGYCDCNNLPEIPKPKKVSVVTHRDTATGNYTATIRWDYQFFPFQKEVEFHLSIASQYQNIHFLSLYQDISPNKRVYRNYVRHKPIRGDKNQKRYEVVWNGFKLDGSHQLRIFAADSYSCTSEDVYVQFIVKDLSLDLFSTSIPIPDQTTEASVSEFGFVGWHSAKSGNVPSRVPPNSPKRNQMKKEEGTQQIGGSKRTNDTSTSQRHPNSPDFVEKRRDTLPKGVSKDSTPNVKPAFFSHGDYLFIFLPIIGLLCLVILLFAICRLFAMRRQKLKQKKQYLDQLKNAPWTLATSHRSAGQITQPMEVNILYREKEIADAMARGIVDEFEVAYERITLGRVIGQGAFGLVFLGRAEAIGGMTGSITVAIKQLKADAAEAERHEFLTEIGMMKRVGSHPNIVNMLGCCTLAYPHCMIMEYVPFGDLLRYLRNIRKEYEQRRSYVSGVTSSNYSCSSAVIETAKSGELGCEVKLPNPVYQNNASRISAMEYLTKGCNSDCQCGTCEVAGDIPFADAEPHGFQECEIVDFSLDPAELQSFALQVASGMSHLEKLGVTHRDLAARNLLVGRGKILKISDFGLSRIGVYVKTTSGRIPLRWLSIEAMREHIYTNKSDLWAYGVVLWEICTLGGFPYPTVSDRDLLKYLTAGNRLEKPSSCSSSIYSLMLQCWSCNPEERPSFKSICEFLKALNQDSSPYVEFNPADALPPEGYCNIAKHLSETVKSPLNPEESDQYDQTNSNSN